MLVEPRHGTPTMPTATAPKPKSVRERLQGFRSGFREA